MKRLRQSGHAHVILLALVVVAAIAGAGYWVWENSESEPVASAPTVPCDGRLYDSHAHPDDDEVIERLPDLIAEYEVGCTVMFEQMNITDIDGSLEQARERYGNMPGRIALFYDIIANDPSEVTKESLEELYEKSGGNFSGFGEFAFYQDPLQGTSLQAEPWFTLFAFAAEKDLPIMIHPMPDLVQDLIKMLSRFKETKVIVHGFELPNQMADLLKQHKNLYYTLDTATMLVLLDNDLPQVLMYPGGGPNTNFDPKAFISIFDAKQQQFVDQTAKQWLPVLKAAPKQVMWGTDISMAGHVDERVYERLISLTDAFAEKVPKKYRQDYLRDNALQLLGPGVTLK